MQCIKPLQIKNPIEKNKRWKPIHYHKYLTVPCGWCMACRINKQQWIATSAEHYFYKRKKGVGAMLMLSYSPEKILKNQIYKDGKIRFSTRYKDGVNYIKRVREYLRRHNLFDDNYIQKDNKYIMATEYGEKAGRSHIHILLLGIDHKKAEKILRKHWDNGFISILPIEKGAVRYITKYLCKGQYGTARKNWEKRTGCEAEKVKHSNGISASYVEDYLQNIIDNQGVVINKQNGRVTTVPPYWCNKYNIRKIAHTTEHVRKQMEDQNVYDPKLSQIQAFREKTQKIKLKQLILNMRNKGQATEIYHVETDL